eukprot:CAMPEP_0202911322 /NCGR_PEP_ID=MMETSP1392-20130828/54644_1 /ASSEMBLY_ACC=CAM_ASM_000868 /TAXON_ID=225041 /ORGANISM="Chlamydomonas chlamydogama, Strain SAG 11-48b" /LENGTH=123 /DNA_ID=CAMNT_0049601787 /DNA_START=59 /DNA_END=427 /DNA_ORIENTATION=+
MSTESSSPNQPPPFPKDCKACSGAKHLIDAFSKFSRSKEQQPLHGPSGAASGAGVPAASESSSNSAAAQTSSTPGKLECPPETDQIGRGTWTFLHTMAAYYPDKPSAEQQSLMGSMLQGLAEF